MVAASWLYMGYRRNDERAVEGDDTRGSVVGGRGRMGV
jgi:hypothetical protein